MGKVLLLAAGSVLLIGAFLLFRPDAAFRDRTVSEAAPAPLASPVPTAAGASGPPQAPPAERRGAFVSVEHPTAGTARLIPGGAGGFTVRLEGLDSTNGPDVRVYLTAAAGNDPAGIRGGRFLSLGPLKGNKGDQNYTVPPGTDLSAFGAVNLWCARFSVPFGYAPLRPAL